MPTVSPLRRHRRHRRAARPRVPVRQHRLRLHRARQRRADGRGPPGATGEAGRWASRRSTGARSPTCGSTCSTPRRCRSTGAASSPCAAGRTPQRLLRSGALVRRPRRRRQGPPARLAHRRRADWLLDLPHRGDRATPRTRASAARSPTSPGVIDTWDVINEVVIMPVFDKERQRPDPAGRGIAAASRSIRLAFDAARAGQPARDAAAQRLRHVDRVRVPHRGRARGGHPDRRPRPAEPHAPGLLGRGEDARRSSTGSRGTGCRCTSPRRRCCPASSCPREIEDLNDHQVAVVAVDARGRGAAGRRDRCGTTATLLSHPAVQAATYWGLTDERRLARRARRARPRRRHAQARVRRAARAGQGRVVAAADDRADRRRRAGAGAAGSSGRTPCPPAAGRPRSR